MHGKVKRGNNYALLPRISPDMTVKQLQVESEARDPSASTTRLNKNELLSLHGAGSIWTSAPASGTTPRDTAVKQDKKTFKKKTFTKKGKKKQMKSSIPSFVGRSLPCTQSWQIIIVSLCSLATLRIRMVSRAQRFVV
jgi:hypothetical protein